MWLWSSTPTTTTFGLLFGFIVYYHNRSPCWSRSGISSRWLFTCFVYHSCSQKYKSLFKCKIWHTYTDPAGGKISVLCSQWTIYCTCTSCFGVYMQCALICWIRWPNLTSYKEHQVQEGDLYKPGQTLWEGPNSLFTTGTGYPSHLYLHARVFLYSTSIKWIHLIWFNVKMWFIIPYFCSGPGITLQFLCLV